MPGSARRRTTAGGRVVQELLTSIRKHAGPGVTAAVSLGYADEDQYISELTAAKPDRHCSAPHAALKATTTALS
jgi:hypothetical protein